MQNPRRSSYWFFFALVVIPLTACGSFQEAIAGLSTPTQTATSTPTPKPTLTLVPTSTPNLAATQQYESFLSLVQDQFDRGNLPTKEGTYFQLEDYSDSLANEGYFQWATVGMQVRNFMISTHVTLSTALRPSVSSGCGIIFRDHNDFHDIVYVQQNGKASYIFNTFKESAQYFGKVSDPAELHLVLIVNKTDLLLFVDEKQAFAYNRSIESTGDLGFTVVSGSNEDYGTRCDFKDTELWVISNP